MSEENHGVEDPKPNGVQDATDDRSEDTDGRSLNAQAKDLKWVKDLMGDSAELKRIKGEQESAAAEAERKRAESQGEYDKALALEQEKRKALETAHQTEKKQLQLDAAFAHADIADPRLVSIFIDGYDPETSATEYVKQVKGDPSNAAFFGKQRRVPPAPGPGEIPPPDDFVPERDLESWRRSKDPKKKARAIAHSREHYRKLMAKRKDT